MSNYNTGMSSYNIDRLRNSNGTFDLCSRRIASGALETEHVTHLQRDGRTVAMRRSVTDGKVLYTLDYSNRICQQFTSLSKAIDAVIDWLNQGKHSYRCGQWLSVWCNQANREAQIKAVIGSQIIVEVEMPGTTSSWGNHVRATTFLCTYDVALGDLRNKRSISYTSCPKKWLQAIDEQSGDWIGMGQRMVRPLSLDEALNRNA